jgi:hypothetical protein
MLWRVCHGHQSSVRFDKQWYLRANDDDDERWFLAARSRTFLSAVDELTGVHAFGGDEQFFALLVAVGVAEVHDGERSTTARIVDDILQLNERTR